MILIGRDLLNNLYELPNDWEWTDLLSLTTVFSDGDWIESKDQSDNGIRLIQTGNVGIGIFKDREEKARFISESTFNRLSCTEIFENDCLISRLPEPIGRSCLIPNMDLKLITSVDCTIVRFNKSVLPKFFIYYSQSNFYFNLITSNATGATRLRISKKNLSKIPIPLPPLTEQQRIVKKLDKLFEKIDKAIALHQKNRDEADVFMGSVLNDVFGELEEKYGLITLDKFSTFQNGFAFKSNEFNTDGIGLRVIRIGNVLDLDKNPVFIDERNEFKRFLLKENDIVISMTGTRKKRDYLFVRVVDSNDSYLNQRVGKISNNEKSNHRYLYYYLNSNSFRDVIFEFETGTVNQGNISSKDIMNSNIPNTPLKIQQKVVTYLDNLSEKIETVKSIQKEKMDRLKALKASILDKAFKGEL